MIYNSGMKALSVRQPWALLIASGEKTIEARTWRTNYRGPLLICASKTVKKCGPIGVAICTVNFVDCRPIRIDDAERACCKIDVEHEFAWVLADARPLEFMYPVSGRLSLFEVELPRTENLVATG